MITRFLALLCAVILTLCSCKKEEKETERYSIVVEITAPGNEIVTGGMYNSSGELLKAYTCKGYMKDEFSTDRQIYYILDFEGQSANYNVKTFFYRSTISMLKSNYSFPKMGNPHIIDTIRPW